MANITINIDDAQLTRVITALSAAFGYQELIETDPALPPIPNPETEGQFVRRKVIEQLKKIVLDQEAQTADNAYRESQTDPGIS